MSAHEATKYNHKQDNQNKARVTTVSLKLQKRLAASILKCVGGKVQLDPNEGNEFSMANSNHKQLPSYHELSSKTRHHILEHIESERYYGLEISKD
ncbi:hypothetical protein RND71_001934 [Anisodus tanguticus]|uniref:Ribosomal protein L19e N-terminal domain-containing protein n=1 Tax=Anisodus tanguticus TaxID=243964 RepID=A0AAE1T368_9SOLA|nr:hypothetical protein RND71_001934 [Anisodus tanguticus]